MKCLSYTAKGATLTRVDPSTSSTTAFTDFADVTFSSSTITANGALIFNEDTSGDTSVCTLAFGGDKTSTAGDFTITFLQQTLVTRSYVLLDMLWPNKLNRGK